MKSLLLTVQGGCDVFGDAASWSGGAQLAFSTNITLFCALHPIDDELKEKATETVKAVARQ